MPTFFADRSEEVRNEAAACFGHLRDVDFGEFVDLIRVYGESPAYPSPHDHLFRRLEDSTWQLPEVSIRLAERFIATCGTQAGNLSVRRCWRCSVRFTNRGPLVCPDDERRGPSQVPGPDRSRWSSSTSTASIPNWRNMIDERSSTHPAGTSGNDLASETRSPPRRPNRLRYPAGRELRSRLVSVVYQSRVSVAPLGPWEWLRTRTGRSNEKGSGRGENRIRGLQWAAQDSNL